MNANKRIDPFVKQNVGNKAGKAINRSAVFIEKRVDLLKALVKDISRNYAGVIATSTVETDEDKDAASSVIETLQNVKNVVSTSVVSIGEYRDAVRGLEKRNLSRSIRIGSKRLADALDDAIRIMRSYASEGDRLRQMLDKKIA